MSSLKRGVVGAIVRVECGGENKDDVPPTLTHDHPPKRAWFSH
jgi:hypothetical protein